MKNPALKNKSLRTGFLVFWSLACTNKAEECIPPTFDYPLDSTLAFQDIQTKGSHNSYHLETTNGLIPEWEYSCAPLSTQLATQGVRQLRGKTLFVLHESGRLRDLYTENGTSDRLMFPDAGGDGTHSFAAIHTLNNPLDDFEKIQALVKNNHLVRTRADSDLEEGRAKDNSRFLTALASGAHFISTDFLIPTEGFDYWVQIPDGTPSRCNPISAPALCTSEDIENPAWMGRCD
jgi:hypothetical protein